MHKISDISVEKIRYTVLFLSLVVPFKVKRLFESDLDRRQSFSFNCIIYKRCNSHGVIFTPNNRRVVLETK